MRSIGKYILAILAVGFVLTLGYGQEQKQVQGQRQAPEAGVSAQEKELATIDVIYTHSGSIWRGQIVEITEDRFYVVETVSGLIIRMPEDAIKSV